jgi:hypothetical protein
MILTYRSRVGFEDAASQIQRPLHSILEFSAPAPTQKHGEKAIVEG